ncbi:MAG: alpha/beta hydrolase [Propionibacteriaceae bacterium]|jgi:pimeloyl-ACP methyl ester carboxylesterase|nr:alpha/beta hydrolase [Propionibacteriaceae bacterium]
MLHKMIEAERGVVHYWASVRPGDRKTLLFTHGLTANHEMFEKQVAFFRDDFNVITWDVPLHGLSRPYADFSYADCAERMKDILDAEGVPRVVLVGMSMGGYPSQAFAAEYPAMVEGFVALDTTPFGLRYYSRSDIWILERVGAMARWFPAETLRKAMAKSVSRTEYSRQLMERMLAPLAKAELVEQMDIAYGGFIKQNRDVRFSFPVLLLLGQYDKTGKVAAYNRQWAQETGYPLVVIDDAAHLSNCDNPDAVNDAILGFVKSLGTRPG